MKKQIFAMLMIILLLNGCTGNLTNSSDPSDEKPTAPSEISSSVTENGNVETHSEDDFSTSDSYEDWEPDNYEKIINIIEETDSNKPFYSDAKPVGINLHYPEQTVKIPLEFDQGASIYDVFIDERTAAIAYHPLSGDDPILVMVSGDQGKTWGSFELPLDGIQQINHVYISFSTTATGYLAVDFDDHNCRLYATSDQGDTWEQVDDKKLVPGQEIYGIAAYSENLYIYGDSQGYPALFVRRRGTELEKVSLTLEKEKYLKGWPVSNAIQSDGNTIVFTACMVDNNDLSENVYFVSEDAGQTWHCFQYTK